MGDWRARFYGFAIDCHGTATASIPMPWRTFVVIQTLGIWWCYWAGAVKNRLVRGRVLVANHHDSVNTSTTNAPIKNQTKGGNSLRCNISSANKFKKLNWLCIAGCEIIASGITSHQSPVWFSVFGFWFVTVGSGSNWVFVGCNYK